VYSKHKLLTTIAFKIKGRTAYALEGSMYHAGTSVQWLRDGLKIISCSAETEALAASLKSNDGVYFVSAFTGLGAPHWISDCGAELSGLSPSSTNAHCARAVLEGVCYQTRDILACMREESKAELLLMRVDGGMADNSWFLQFLADQCNLSIQKPKDIETTARGAAILAGIGCGLFNSIAEIKGMWHKEQEFTPARSAQIIEQDYQGWLKALNRIKS
jgi:glycerol kinase